jgi:hypothetical protein
MRHASHFSGQRLHDALCFINRAYIKADTELKPEPKLALRSDLTPDMNVQK